MVNGRRRRVVTAGAGGRCAQNIAGTQRYGGNSKILRENERYGGNSKDTKDMAGKRKIRKIWRETERYDFIPLASALATMTMADGRRPPPPV